MGKKSFKVDLSEASIRQMKRYLENYQINLRNRNVLFVQKLAERGIEVGKQHGGEYGDYLVFTYTRQGAGKTVVSGKITISQTEFIRRYWYYKGEVTYADVSPVLMAEFGSGQYAAEGHQGTFPGQKHADDPNGWHWTDLEGVTHHSTGESPTEPGHWTVLGIIEEIENVAREVFGR